MDSASSPTVLSDDEVPLKEEVVNSEPWTCTLGRDAVLQQLRNVEASDIVMIDDDEELNSTASTTSPSAHCQLAGSLGSEQLSSAPDLAARPKKKLFNSSLAFAPSINVFKLPTPPPSDSSSPEHSQSRNPFEIDLEDASGFADLSRILSKATADISSAQQAQSGLPVFTGVGEKGPANGQSTTALTKQRAEAQGCETSRALREKRLLDKRAAQQAKSRDISTVTPCALPRKQADPPVVKPAASQNQPIEVLSSDEDESSKAWEHLAQAIGRQLTPAPKQFNNPYSRDAANQYRTQDRHLGDDKNTKHTTVAALTSNDIQPKTKEELLRMEARLLRIKRNQPGQKRQRDPPGPFYAPDLGEKPKRQRTNSSKVLRKPAQDHAAEADHAILDVSAPITGALSELTALQNRPKTQELPKLQEQDFDTMYPPQDSEATWDRDVSQYADVDKTAILLRDRLQNRQKDLNAIVDTNMLIAKLLAVREADSNMEEWINEFKVYKIAVLDEDRSGKLQRQRIKNIGDNCKRRLTSCGIAPNPTTVNARCSEIITPEQMERLKIEIPRIDSELPEAKKQATARSQARKNAAQRGGPSIRGTSTARTTRSQSSLPQQVPKGTSRIEQQIAAKRAELAEVTARIEARDRKEAADKLISGDSEQTRGVETMELDFGSPQDEASESESVEDDDEDYTRPVDSKPTPLIRNVEQSERQNVEASPVVPPTYEVAVSSADTRKSSQASSSSAQQRPNGELLARMQRKAAQPAIIQPEDLPLAVEPVEKHDKSINNSADTDISESTPEDNQQMSQDETDDETDTEEPGACWQYILSVKTIGLGSRDVSDDISCTTFSAKKADAAMRGWPAQFFKLFKRNNPGVSFEDQKVIIERTGEECTEELTFGQTDQYGYRAVLSKKLVSKGHVAYEEAKTKKAIRKYFIYFVNWKKTITQIVPNDADKDVGEEADLAAEIGTAVDTQETQPESIDVQSTQETPETLQSATAISRSATPSERDSLFGDDEAEPLISRPPSGFTSTRTPEVAPSPIIERPQDGQIVPFYNIAWANRHAKNVFLTWYHRALPGRCNEDYHKQQDEEIEEELARIGNRVVWSREEECPIAQEDGTEKMERFQVWVERLQVKGAPNEQF